MVLELESLYRILARAMARCDRHVSRCLVVFSRSVL